MFKTLNLVSVVISQTRNFVHTHVLKVDFEVFHSLKFIVQFIATKL